MGVQNTMISIKMWQYLEKNTLILYSENPLLRVYSEYKLVKIQRKIRHKATCCKATYDIYRLKATKPELVE
jgi:hypothetical protein